MDSKDRQDRIDAIEDIAKRLDLPSRTASQRLDDLCRLGVESSRATNLMLAQDFVKQADLKKHCESMHKSQPWNFARFSAVTISVLLVCSTAVGITMKLAPEKMDPPQPSYYVSPDKRNQPEK